METLSEMEMVATDASDKPKVCETVTCMRLSHQLDVVWLDDHVNC